MDSGVVPFHQPGAGSVVSTVRVPALTGVIEMLFGLLVMLQSPIFVAPPLAPASVAVEESDEPHAAMVTARAAALIRPSERLRRMVRSSFHGSRGRVAWGHSGRTVGWSQAPRPLLDAGS